MKNRIQQLVGIVFVLLLCGVVTGAQTSVAAPTGTHNLVPTDDAYIGSDTGPTGDGTAFNGVTLRVYGDVLPGGGCSPNRVSYLLFDLSGITPSEKIESATLTLAVNSGAPQDGSTMTMAVEGTTNVAWSEDGVGQPVLHWVNNRPTLGTPLASKPMVVSGSIEFSDALLTKFLDDNKGHSVTLGITPVACAGNQPAQWFHSKENTSGAAVPTLSINPTTAVTLRTFRSADPAVNWPLIAGLGALVALVAGGILFYRKRATTH